MPCADLQHEFNLALLNDAQNNCRNASDSTLQPGLKLKCNTLSEMYPSLQSALKVLNAFSSQKIWDELYSKFHPAITFTAATITSTTFITTSAATTEEDISTSYNITVHHSDVEWSQDAKIVAGVSASLVAIFTAGIAIFTARYNKMLCFKDTAQRYETISMA